MAYIKVNHSKFSKAASEVEEYASFLRKKMTSATGEVDDLAANWQGSDFTQFKKEWNKMKNKDSTYRQMVNTLDSYAEFLQYASEKYKDAQAKAVNRANGLPRY